MLKNYGDSEVRNQDNPGIKQFIETLMRQDGIYLTKSSFEKAFKTLVETLKDPKSVYRGIENFKMIGKDIEDKIKYLHIDQNEKSCYICCTRLYF